MTFPRLPLWLASGFLSLSVLTAAFPSKSQGQHPWFHKPRPAAPCPTVPCPEPTLPAVKPPEVKPPDVKPPEVKPPVDLPPEPTAEPVTTAALGSDQVSINMFGDRFGASGFSRIASGTPISFSNYFVFNQNSKGGFISPVPPGRLAFAPSTTSPITYLQSVPGAGPGPVQKNQVFGLDNSQPFFNANGQPLEIRNGTAKISGFTSQGDTLIPLADGSYTRIDQVVIGVPNPGAGGVVGRPRLSEDLNPLPRDRLIFNYDYFNQTQLSTTGQDVHRYTLGVEKTFFDRMASVEVRVPFASTMSSDIVTSGTQANRTEFGDVRILLKGLMYSSRTINVAGGLGIYLPTASDTNVALANGTNLVHIDNKAVILSPYLGILLTPNDRLFSQVWVACDFDTNGCPVQVANPTLTGLQAAGRIQDQTLMQWDLQVGYWLLRPGDGEGVVKGLAPFTELHYGTTLNNADFVQANGFVIGNFANRVDDLTIASGFAAQLYDNLLVSVGAVAPLRQNFDRGFDYQIGLRASYFFGPTAAQRRAANYISSF